MKAIRRKIYFVIGLMVIATAIGVFICVKESNLISSKPSIKTTAVVVNYESRQRGEALFNENCSACHRVGPGWMAEGPRLETVGERLSDTTIKQFLFYPEKTIASNDYLRNIFNAFHNVSHPSFL